MGPKSPMDSMESSSPFTEGRNEVEEENPVVEKPSPMVMSRANSSLGSMKASSSRTSSASSQNTKPNGPNRNNNINNNSNNRSHQELFPLEDAVVGIIASGFSWVQRSRERRRREYLQYQAELQMRKIAQAELSHRNMDSKGSADSNERLRLSYSDEAAANGAGNDQSGEQNVSIGTKHLSKSGEGASADFDFDLQEAVDDYLIPKVRIEKEPSRKIVSEDGESVSFEEPTYLLSPQQMHQIAIRVLPRTIAYCPWRRLYGLTRDGDSFDGCLRLISEAPRTLMVVRTTKGEVFGGYADSSWKSSELGNNKFYGSASACLFSVNEPDNHALPPKDMLNVYKWSGKNRYIQLCDVSHKMMAFGGGGLNGAFGLCVQEDFQNGSTGPCDTFDNEPLSSDSPFEIVDVEFWEFLTGVF
eukprot:Nitzschia sp. Nitz4//scaffold25_size161228//109528//110772//NITZ4_002444-RA/size161228-processed-gene-0.166-mRNA-1//1//CDS//3329544628//3800//frame0